MFSELELKLFDIAYRALISETPLFDNLGQHKEIYEVGTGIEGFIQTKLIHAFLNKGLFTTTKGKRARDTDFIVENVGVELKGELKKNQPKWLLSALTKHPNADIYLLFSRTDVKSTLLCYFEQNKYDEKHKQLNPRWIIWIVKKGRIGG